MKLEITKEKVLAMAKKCPEAKEILREGFPEAFESMWVDVTESLEFRPYKAGCYYWIGIYNKYVSLQIGWLDNAGAHICTHAEKSYRIEKYKSGEIRSWGWEDNYFRIMKKN